LAGGVRHVELASQNRMKPVPVPENVTLIAAPEWAFMNSWATASAMGKAVLDPSTVTGSLGARA
jgi:hypothetical protein